MTGLVTKARKLAGILAVPAWRAALRRHRVAAGVEHARVLRTLGEVRTVVDIGANRGQFALAARHCFPQARIVSFEPLAGRAAFEAGSKSCRGVFLQHVCSGFGHWQTLLGKLIGGVAARARTACSCSQHE